MATRKHLLLSILLAVTSPVKARLQGSVRVDKETKESLSIIPIMLPIDDERGCGGTLIAPDIVLTAAHCPDYTGQTLKIGAKNRTCTQWVPHQDFVVRGEHQEDKSNLFDNDFALCKLNAPVFFDESERKLVFNKDPDLPPAGEIATVIGLGRVESHYDSLARFIQHVEAHVEAPMFSHGRCYVLYTDIGDSSLKLCAGSWDPNISDIPSSCRGDSGGPNGILYSGCGAFGLPDIKARVSAFIDWIEGTACGVLESEHYCATTTTPTELPTKSATDAPSLERFCVNDPTFRANNIHSLTCDWISEKPTTRCLLDSGAELGCPATCNPGCIGCANDPDYRNNGKEKRTCEWVAKKSDVRCKDQPSFDACPATCNPDCA